MVMAAREIEICATHLPGEQISTPIYSKPPDLVGHTKYRIMEGHQEMEHQHDHARPVYFHSRQITSNHMQYIWTARR